MTDAMRMAKLFFILIVLVGFLAILYYVVHNLSWWGFGLLVLMLIATMLVVSAQCRKFVGDVLDRE